MELAISKLTARRVIYYFEGYVKGERPKGLKFVFYNYDLKITIKPSVFEWDGDTFRMMLHVEQANENNPISSGDYYPIAVDGKGKQYPLQVAKSIIEEREQAEWKNDVVVNKGKGHHVICKSLMDLDTDELFIHVDTVLPKPRKNYIRRKCGELYYGVRNDLKDWHRSFLWLFLIFSTSAVKSVAIRFYSVPDHVLKLVEMKNLFTTVCLSVDWTKNISLYWISNLRSIRHTDHLK